MACREHVGRFDVGQPPAWGTGGLSGRTFLTRIGAARGQCVPDHCINLSLSVTLRNLPILARIAVLMTAGAMPVSAIPLYILG
jgi:hypothetical protein